MTVPIVARTYTQEFHNVANTTALLIARIEGHSADNQSLELRAAGWEKTQQTKNPLRLSEANGFPVFAGGLPSQPGSVFLGWFKWMESVLTQYVRWCSGRDLFSARYICR